jgi:hypothetical protein
MLLPINAEDFQTDPAGKSRSNKGIYDNAATNTRLPGESYGNFGI